MLPDYISTVLAILSLAGGAVAWYSTRIKRGYGFERDINHLKRDYQQLSANVEALIKTNDERLDDIEIEIVRLKAKFEVITPNLSGRLTPDNPT